ncbi:MAG TPA: SDR family NAD(P)-dependent oxidoreductase [Acidimicrobiales bacterium]|nr:SDR family NAD(P)-dependent oxidoreductase [Acidimicrobiales bacterium]
MSRIFVTGSTDGVGKKTVEMLVAQGHQVVGHARTDPRAHELQSAVPGVSAVVVGDLESLAQTTDVADQAREEGPYDVVVHNAGIGGGGDRQVTGDGYERIFQVNVLAPYVLTCLLGPPARLVYLTSGLHETATLNLDDLHFQDRRWDGMDAYSASKLCDVLLAFAVARHWPGTFSNAVDPGWIKTRMGGPGAPGTLDEGAATQVWLATSDDPAATVTGRYFKNCRQLEPNPLARDVSLQEDLLRACRAMTGGVQLPGAS